MRLSARPPRRLASRDVELAGAWCVIPDAQLLSSATMTWPLGLRGRTSPEACATLRACRAGPCPRQLECHFEPAVAYSRAGLRRKAERPKRRLHARRLINGSSTWWGDTRTEDQQVRHGGRCPRASQSAVMQRTKELNALVHEATVA